MCSNAHGYPRVLVCKASTHARRETSALTAVVLSILSTSTRRKRQNLHPEQPHPQDTLNSRISMSTNGRAEIRPPTANTQTELSTAATATATAATVATVDHRPFACLRPPGDNILATASCSVDKYGMSIFCAHRGPIRVAGHPALHPELDFASRLEDGDAVLS